MPYKTSEARALPSRTHADSRGERARNDARSLSRLFLSGCLAWLVIGCGGARPRPVEDADAGFIFGHVSLPKGAPNAVTFLTYKEGRMFGGAKAGAIYPNGDFFLENTRPGTYYGGPVSVSAGNMEYNMTNGTRDVVFSERKMKPGEMWFAGSFVVGKVTRTLLLRDGKFDVARAEDPQPAAILLHFLRDEQFKASGWSRRVEREIKRLKGQ